MHQVSIFLCAVCRFDGRELFSVVDEYGLAVENGVLVEFVVFSVEYRLCCNCQSGHGK
jgi:hypothetical protein